jgi:hypothetical protein
MSDFMIAGKKTGTETKPPREGSKYIDPFRSM